MTSGEHTETSGGGSHGHSVGVAWRLALVVASAGLHALAFPPWDFTMSALCPLSGTLCRFADLLERRIKKGLKQSAQTISEGCLEQGRLGLKPQAKKGSTLKRTGARQVRNLLQQVSPLLDAGFNQR
jgi:hypothetical protein